MRADSADSVGRTGTRRADPGDRGVVTTTRARRGLGLQRGPVNAVVNGSTATYADILPDTDLEFVTSRRLKETLTLNRRGRHQWVFPWADRVDGASANDGSVELVMLRHGGRPDPGRLMSDSHFDDQTVAMTRRPRSRWS